MIRIAKATVILAPLLLLPRRWVEAKVEELRLSSRIQAGCWRMDDDGLRRALQMRRDQLVRLHDLQSDLGSGVGPIIRKQRSMVEATEKVARKRGLL